MSKAMKQLKRMRNLRAVITVITLLLIGTSVMLNVAHAPANPMAQFVAGLPPVAAFFVIELIARIPASNKALAVGRIIGSLVVGGIAGTVSYVAQIDYVLSLGFDSWVASVFPAIIDGTMLVTTLSLVEVVRKVRQLEEAAEDDAPSVAREGNGVASEPEKVDAGSANSVPDSPAELVDGNLAAAPVSPAPAGPRRGRPKRDTVPTPTGAHVDAETGEPLPERTERRARTGK